MAKPIKQIEKEIKITYRWWRTDGKPIKPSHIPALDETAEERIKDMMKEGYTSGELNDNIRMHDNDGQDGIGYTGWFEVAHKTL